MRDAISMSLAYVWYATLVCENGFRRLLSFVGYLQKIYKRVFPAPIQNKICI